jgi:hypothetical protein
MKCVTGKGHASKHSCQLLCEFGSLLGLWKAFALPARVSICSSFTTSSLPCKEYKKCLCFPEVRA